MGECTHHSKYKTKKGCLYSIPFFHIYEEIIYISTHVFFGIWLKPHWVLSPRF